MKKLLFPGLALFSIGALTILFSCKKTYTQVGTYTYSDSNVAHLKVFDASVNFRSITTMQDTFAVYVDGTRVSGPNLSFGAFSPGVATNTYSAVPPNGSAIRLVVPGIANGDSVTISTYHKSLNAAQYYSLIVTDSFTNASRDTTRMLVRDLFTTPNPGFVNLRFIHAALNDTAGKTVDLFSYAKNAAIFSKIKPDSATTFLSVGVNAQTADTIYVRRTGTTQTLAKLLFLPVSQRTYTLVYYGDATTTSGKKARTLTFYSH